MANAISLHVGFPIISFGGILKGYSMNNGLPAKRKNLQQLGQKIIDQFGFEGFIRLMISHSAISWDESLIDDVLWHKEVYGNILRMFPRTLLVYCDCDLETQISRMITRDGINKSEVRQMLSYETEMYAERLQPVAQLVFQPNDNIEDFTKRLDDFISQMRM